MARPLLKPLWQLDRHLLLNYPALWLLRLHWVVLGGLAGLIIYGAIGLVVPVQLASIQLLERYFLITAVLGYFAAIPWLYFHVRSLRRIQEIGGAQFGTHLVAIYLVVAAIPPGWAWTLEEVAKARICGQIDSSDLAADMTSYTELIEELDALLVFSSSSDFKAVAEAWASSARYRGLSLSEYIHQLITKEADYSRPFSQRDVLPARAALRRLKHDGLRELLRLLDNLGRNRLVIEQLSKKYRFLRDGVNSSPRPESIDRLVFRIIEDYATSARGQGTTAKSYAKFIYRGVFAIEEITAPMALIAEAKGVPLLPGFSPPAIKYPAAIKVASLAFLCLLQFWTLIGGGPDLFSGTLAVLSLSVFFPLFAGNFIDSSSLAPPWQVPLLLLLSALGLLALARSFNARRGGLLIGLGFSQLVMHMAWSPAWMGAVLGLSLESDVPALLTRLIISVVLLLIALAPGIQRRFAALRALPQ